MPASLTPVISIDPSDPAYALVRATKALNEQAQKEFGALCEKLAMEVVASVTAAQDSARSQAEAIIGQSGVWAAGEIRRAVSEAVLATGDDRARIEAFAVNMKRSLHFLWIAVCVAAGIGLINLATFGELLYSCL